MEKGERAAGSSLWVAIRTQEQLEKTASASARARGDLSPTGIALYTAQFHSPLTPTLRGVWYLHFRLKHTDSERLSHLSEEAQPRHSRVRV